MILYANHTERKIVTIKVILTIMTDYIIIILRVGDFTSTYSSWQLENSFCFGDNNNTLTRRILQNVK